MSYTVDILSVGYSKPVENGFKANCTCCVIRGKYNVIVDTMTPWDQQIIIDGLKKLNLNCHDINYVVSTHGHSDHLGNNNLFLDAIHIVGNSCVSKEDLYFDTPIIEGMPYSIDKEDLQIIATPGHTLADISVVVKTKEGTVVIAGDLFESEEDLKDELIWRAAGSESPENQIKNRAYVLSIADWIIPGHGNIFKVQKSDQT